MNEQELKDWYPCEACVCERDSKECSELRKEGGFVQTENGCGMETV